MGREKPSNPRHLQIAKKSDRAKRARETLNKTIPALLASNPRAKQGVGSVKLIASTKPQTSVNNIQTPISDLRIRVLHTDTLTAAAELLEPGKRGSRIAILNMGSVLRPGGGFLSGANSQEEFLCMRTTLLPSLQDSFYRLPEEGLVHTPDVLVFRNADGMDLPKAKYFYVDVLTAGMIRSPEVDHDRYCNEADREMVARKMRAVLRICVAQGLKRVVLGAWGCGAYGNPVAEVAQAWRRVILGVDGKGRARAREVWEGVEEIVFAITDVGMVDAFRDCFKAILAEDASINDRSESFRESVEEATEVSTEEMTTLTEGQPCIGNDMAS